MVIEFLDVVFSLIVGGFITLIWCLMSSLLVDSFDDGKPSELLLAVQVLMALGISYMIYRG